MASPAGRCSPSPAASRRARPDEDETRIEVEVEKGTKPGKDKVVLARRARTKAHKDVPLKPLVCGGLSECKNQPDGEVYRYEASVPGKDLALDIAIKGEGVCRSMRRAPRSPRRPIRPPSRNSPSAA